MVNSILEDKIHKLIVVEDDLFEVLHSSGHSSLTKALGKLEFLLVIDTKLTETMKYADLILPGATAYERDGTFTNDKNRVQRLNKSIDPPGNSKPQWEIIIDLIEMLGKAKSDFENPDGIFNTISENIPTFYDMSYEKIGHVGMSKQT